MVVYLAEVYLSWNSADNISRYFSNEAAALEFARSFKDEMSKNESASASVTLINCADSVDQSNDCTRILHIKTKHEYKTYLEETLGSV